MAWIEATDTDNLLTGLELELIIQSVEYRLRFRPSEGYQRVHHRS